MLGVVAVLLNASHVHTHAPARTSLPADSWVSGNTGGASKPAAAAASWISPNPALPRRLVSVCPGIVISCLMPRSSHRSRSILPANAPAPPIAWPCTLDEGRRAKGACTSEKLPKFSGGAGLLREVVRSCVPGVVVVDDHHIRSARPFYAIGRGPERSTTTRCSGRVVRCKEQLLLQAGGVPSSLKRPVHQTNLPVKLTPKIISRLTLKGILGHGRGTHGCRKYSAIPPSSSIA